MHKPVISGIFLLFFSVTSKAGNSSCKTHWKKAVGGIELELQKIILNKGDRRSLDQWLKGLDSSSDRQRRSTINYLLDEDEGEGGLLKIRRKYPSVYPVVYNRLLEVVRSDGNPDLQLRVFRALYVMDPQDDNWSRLAEVNSLLYDEINVIDGLEETEIEELIVEDGVYRD